MNAGLSDYGDGNLMWYN